MASLENSLINLKEKALRELNESPDTRSQYVNEIRQWILEEESFYGATDEEFILKFLRNCKFNVVRTKQKITKYYHTRTDSPEIFKNRDGRLQDVKELLQLGVIVPLGYDSEGRKVVLARYGIFDPKTLDIHSLFKLLYMVTEFSLRDVQTQICGVVAVADMTGVTTAHLRPLSFSLIKKTAVYFHKVIPLRMKKLFYWNSPFYYTLFYNLIKIFLPEKIRQRVEFIGSDINSLHRCVSPAYLPQEYSGTAGSMSKHIALLEKKISELNDWFLDDEKYGLLDDGGIREVSKIQSCIPNDPSSLDMEID